MLVIYLKQLIPNAELKYKILYQTLNFCKKIISAV